MFLLKTVVQSLIQIFQKIKRSKGEEFAVVQSKDKILIRRCKYGFLTLSEIGKQGVRARVLVVSGHLSAREDLLRSGDHG